MYTSTTLLILAATASAQLLFTPNNPSALRRQASEESYIASVCTPNTTTPIPPCTAIVNIEEQCQPNNTTPQGYLAHQQCMCNGGFFANWNGCLQCQYVHGARSEAVVDAFKAIISSASVELCTGTPTASFAAIFSSISQAAPQSVAGQSTVLSDLYPSQSAVSLYYTNSGNQGAGVITGSAASATATAHGTASTAVSASNDAASLVSSVSATSGGAASSSAATISGARTSMGVTSSSAGSATAARGSASASASSAQTGAANRINIVGALAVLAAGVHVL